MIWGRVVKTENKYLKPIQHHVIEGCPGHLHGGHLEAEEGEEHEDKKDPARKLQIHFRLVLSQARHLSKIHEKYELLIEGHMAFYK